jgi:hypothetical protein
VSRGPGSFRLDPNTEGREFRPGRPGGGDQTWSGSTRERSGNALSAAHAAGRFVSELRKYLRPALLVIDELGYLPIDKRGADLLFQIISERYEPQERKPSRRKSRPKKTIC